MTARRSSSRAGAHRWLPPRPRATSSRCSSGARPSPRSPWPAEPPGRPCPSSRPVSSRPPPCPRAPWPTPASTSTRRAARRSRPWACSTSSRLSRTSSASTPTTTCARRLFDEIQGGEDACANLDYARDVEPWLGNRAGVGLVDAEATVVVVVQVSDADAAAAGLEKLKNCVANGDASKAAPPDAHLGFALEGDWAVLAETTEIAERVAADGASSSLADDADFQTWTESRRRPRRPDGLRGGGRGHRDLRLGRRPAPDGGTRPQHGGRRWRGHRPDEEGVRGVPGDGGHGAVLRRLARARVGRRVRPAEHHLLRHRSR